MLKNKKIDFAKIANLSAVILVFTLSSNVYADIIIEHSGSLAVGSQYHSNLLLLPKRFEESVILYSLTPQYKLSALDERNKWFGNLGVQIERASDKDIAQDIENPFATLGWEHAFFLGTVSLQAEYLKQRLVNSQFGQTGVVSQNGTSEFKSLTGRWNYNFSPKWILDTNINYSDSKFQDVAGLAGFRELGYGAKVNYILNETISPYASFAAFDFKPDEGQGAGINKWQNYVLGTAIDISPTFDVDVSGGITNFDANVDNGYVAAVIVNYSKNRHTITAGLQRTVFPTGEQRVETGDSFTSSYVYGLTEKSNIGVGANLTKNESDLETEEFTGFYSRDLTPTWILRLNLAHRTVGQGIGETFKDSSLGLSLIYTSFNF